ncbi:hypothetical protein [Nocardioides dilutus]
MTADPPARPALVIDAFVGGLAAPTGLGRPVQLTTSTPRWMSLVAMK